MYIEVNDDRGRTYFDSSCIKSIHQESFEDFLADDPTLHKVWILDTNISFLFKTKEKADGCYEYLKGFVKD